MSAPSLSRILEVMDATWPAQERVAQGPFWLRRGNGGGNRVSSASLFAPSFTEHDIDAAEAGLRAFGQTPLFMIRDGDEALDAALAARGYKVIDPVAVYLAPLDAFEPPEPMRAFPHWPPLARGCEIWEEHDICAARQAVMARASGPKAAVLGRAPKGVDRANGMAFVACDGDIAMLHALIVEPQMRRQGGARHILRAAADWARGAAVGANWLSLVVTRENLPARELYSLMNMQLVGGYHYRSA